MSVFLVNRFPRQMGRPFKDFIAYDIDDVNNYILKYGGFYGIHISTYAFSTIDKGMIDYESAIIDKVYGDIDSIDWLNQIRRVFKLIVYDYDIISRYTMSGEGVHFYIFCREQIEHKRNTIFNFLTFLERKLNVNIDSQIKGDLARSFRIPETYNHRRKRYAICMDEDLIFNHTKEEIHKIAEKFPPYRPKKIWYGNNLADLSVFDKDSYMYGIKMPTQLNGNLLNLEQIKKLNLPTKIFPPCVRSWLANDDLRHKGRFSLIIYLRDQTITYIPLLYKEIVSILKNILNENRWKHVSTDMSLPGFGLGENLRPVKKAFSNINYKMYSCYQLRDFGLCPRKCGRWHPIYD